MTKNRILIIDDDEELCSEVAELLTDEGYSVRATSDPVKGNGLIAAHTFDIALFDYKLPGITGVDLLTAIKKKNPKTRVFIVSGKPFLEKQLKEEKVLHLIAGIISKLFDCEELLEKVKG